MNILRIGTRGSRLALIQAETVKQLLLQHFPQQAVEIRIIKTEGDIKLDAPLDKQLNKGLFTSEIENCLHQQTIDIAVHSLKDLPVEMVPGMCIGAYLKRANPFDVLISREGKCLKELSETDVIATSSPRRKAQLLAIRPNQQIISIRGNVETRIQKMNDGYCDALIMAAAGLERLSLEDQITEYLDEKRMLPAPGQGVIAVEARIGDTEVLRLLQPLHHQISANEVEMERRLLQAIGGGCSQPLGCLCRYKDGLYDLQAFLGDRSLQSSHRAHLSFPETELNERLSLMTRLLIHE